MKKTNCAAGALRFVRSSILASLVILALVAYGSQAGAQATAASQTTPEKKVDFGVGSVSGSSYKFGEYNGLQNSGPYGIGNFDIRGGEAFDSKSTWRWRLQGTNLGLENRSLSATFGHQGKFRVFLSYSELLANRSDTFQTPYLGTSTGIFTLPSTWVLPAVPQLGATKLNFRALSSVAGAGSYYTSSGVLTAPTSTQLAALAVIDAADLPLFQNVNLSTKRTRVDAGISYIASENLDLPISYTFEHKDGLKAQAIVSSQVSETSVTLPTPIDYDTSQANAAANYKFKKLYLSFAYYGSFFKNNVNSINYQDPADPTKTATVSLPPSNQFNQFTLSAVQSFKGDTKLAVSGSYGRNTQNDPFLGPSTAANGQLAFGLPAQSLNGIVVSSMAHAKFTSKPTKKLSFVAEYKFFDRDNQTAVNTYLFQDVNESKSGTSSFNGVAGLPTTMGSNTNIYQNRSYSQMQNQANAEVEYAIAKKETLQGSYEWQKIDRSCDGAWINCSDAPTTQENTIGGEWRRSSAASFSARINYAYSWRRGTYDEEAFLALVPMANQIPTGGATQSVLSYLKQNSLTAFGPIAGLPTTALTGNAAIFTPNNNIVPQALYGSRNNINELPGMRRYMEADRNTHKVFSDLNWQASDKFSIHGNGQFNDQDYLNSAYGLKKDVFWEASMDASYSPSDNFTADVYYTYDNQRNLSRGDAYGSNSTTAFQGQAANTVVSGGCFATIALKNASAKIDPCLNWGKNERNMVDTLGFSLDRKNLLANKLELASEVFYTRARTATAVSGGSYVNNPLALAAPAPALTSGTPAVYYIAAGNYPLVRNDEITIAPTAQLSISKAATLKAYYLFQRMMTSNWSYLGMQYGTGTATLPSSEKSPNYAESAGGLSLVWAF